METMAIIYRDVPGLQGRVQALAVPDGVDVHYVPVPAGTANLAASFQQAMQQSQAHYKVYVSEDVAFLAHGLLADIVRAFQAQPDVGLLGLSGTQQLLTSGITYLSPERVGIVLDDARRPLAGVAATGRSAPVQALDGYVLATQHDVDWPAGLLQGSLFLGPAASCEYRRAGCGVAVLTQPSPACQLLQDALSAAAGEQDAFLDAYSRDLYPLVSIVIPTYARPEYFRQALSSAQQQTYRNLDIFVTDNSHDERTKRVYEQQFSGDPRIRYEHHPEDDAAGNWHRAIAYDNPDATYVNWLMDDDLFHPEKIAAMMDYYFQMPDLALVTSYRRLIDADGNELPDEPWTKPPFASTTRVQGDGMRRAMLLNMVNVIGEPTTALVKKSTLYHGRFGWPGQSEKYWISDYPTWFYVLSQGDVLYMTEPMSFFRQHGGQQQKDSLTYVAGLICWALMVREACTPGSFASYLSTDEEKLQAITRWLLMGTGVMEMFYQHPEMKTVSYWQDFLKVYAGMSEALVNGCHVAFDLGEDAGRGLPS